MSFSITAKFEFDAAGLKAKQDRKNNRVLIRTGFFGRRVMRNSIRKAPKKYTPNPGSPPRYHVRPGFKTVVFGVERDNSVSIGLLKYGDSKPYTVDGVKYQQRTRGGLTVPELVDQGGEAIRQITYHDGKRQTERMNYGSFPYTEPAFDPTRDKMLELFETIQL